MMLPEQVRHEEAIAAAHRSLVASRDHDQRVAYAGFMVSLIRARDPDITRQMEAARMRRVGL